MWYRRENGLVKRMSRTKKVQPDEFVPLAQCHGRSETDHSWMRAAGGKYSGVPSTVPISLPRAKYQRGVESVFFFGASSCHACKLHCADRVWGVRASRQPPNGQHEALWRLLHYRTTFPAPSRNPSPMPALFCHCRRPLSFTPAAQAYSHVV